MKPVLRCAVAVTLAIVVPRSLTVRAADVAKLRYLAAAYADEKGAGLKLPEAVACDANGNVLVGDTANDRLVRFTYRDRTLNAGGEIRLPEVSEPTRVQLTSKGEILVLDSRRRRIARIGADGVFASALELGSEPGAASIPRSFALDTADNVYVLDVLGARVVVLDAAGRFQRAVPLPDDVGFVSDLTVDAAGTIVAIDGVKRRLLSAAKDAKAFEPLGGDLTDAVTTMPAAITLSAGILFVVEGAGSSIVTLARDGTFLARQLTAGWAEGALNHPSQMCVTPKGEVFVADRDNARVQMFGLIR